MPGGRRPRRRRPYSCGEMLHYYKFRQDLFAPQPAKDVYVKRGPGKGWPEECPPIRGANSFGFDLLANFDVTFTQGRGGAWRAAPGGVLPRDFDYPPPPGSPRAAPAPGSPAVLGECPQLPPVLTRTRD